MKPRVAVIAVAAVVASSLVGMSASDPDRPAIVAKVHSQEHDDGPGCTNASLRGSYGFYRTGTTSAGPLASIGILSFDGNGNATATQSTSRNGVFTFDAVISGTYEIAEDCTGKEFTPEGVEFARLVVVDRGKEFYLFSETAGNTIYGVGRKIGHTP
jgi:hypothetical protein